MANQKNYVTDLQTLSESYTKYTVSRIIANKKDNLLDMEMPADFSDALLENTVEINLYSLADNSLVYSNVMRNVSGSIYTETLQYEDNSFRKLLFVDFSKAQITDIPTGQYSVTVNFFADELGSFDNRVLKITKISTSRTEVELQLTDTTLQSNLEQFAIPRIPARYTIPILQQIFNQEKTGSVTLPISPAKIDSSSIYQNFSSGSGELLIQYGFDEDDGSRLGINTIAQNVLDEAYKLVTPVILGKIQSGSTSFTEAELNEYVIDAIDVAYDSAINDETNNPQNYRFDLI